MTNDCNFPLSRSFHFRNDGHSSEKDSCPKEYGSDNIVGCGAWVMKVSKHPRRVYVSELMKSTKQKIGSNGEGEGRSILAVSAGSGGSEAASSAADLRLVLRRRHGAFRLA